MGEDKKNKKRKRDASSSSSGSSGSEEVAKKKKQKKEKHSEDKKEKKRQSKHEEEKEKKKKSKKEKKKRDSSSDSSGSDSSSSSSSSEEKKKKKKKDKKEKKSKKEKKGKKDKKGKRKTKAGNENGINDMSGFGARGILRPEDMNTKRAEFLAWLTEVKNVNMETMSKWDQEKMEGAYMEDYNTCTFPSSKYYDLNAFETKMAKKKMKRGAMSAAANQGAYVNDEKRRQMEIADIRKGNADRDMAQTMSNLKADLDMGDGRVKEMREQEKLKVQLQQALKMGRTEEASKLRNKLDPEAAEKARREANAVFQSALTYGTAS